MKGVHSKGINYHISETDLHNQNLVEGVIREVKRKCHRTIGKEKGTKATMGLWFKLINVNDLFFIK